MLGRLMATRHLRAMGALPVRSLAQFSTAATAIPDGSETAGLEGQALPDADGADPSTAPQSEDSPEALRRVLARKTRIPWGQKDTRGIKDFLQAPLVLLKGVSKSAITRDVSRFVKSKGPIEIEGVYCLRNEDLQPIGNWIILTRTLEDARVFLKNNLRGELFVGASRPEVLPKSALSERFLTTYFFFELGEAAGRSVLVRGVDTFLSPDLVRNNLRPYDLSRYEKNIINLEHNTKSSLKTHSILLKMTSESEAHRLVRERDNTVLFPKAMDKPVRLEVIY